MTLGSSKRRASGLVCTLALTAWSVVPAQAPPDGSTTRTTRLQGRAFLGRRQPVIGASVLAKLQDGGRAFLTVTDEKGDFRFENMPEGTYRVELRRADLVPVIKEGVALQAPFRAVLELPMVAAPQADATRASGNAAPPTGTHVRLAGRVTDRDGAPMPDVRMRWVAVDGRGDPAVTTTRSDGSFEVSALSAGEWRVHLLGLGYLPLRATMPVERDAQLDIVLVRQSASYEPLAIDIIPEEEPIPPPAAAVVP